MSKAIKDIRGTDSGELRSRLRDLHKEQFETRLRGPGEGQASNQRFHVRRTIARILTVLGERERNLQDSSQKTGAKT